MTRFSVIIVSIILLASTSAFTTPPLAPPSRTRLALSADNDDVLNRAIEMMSGKAPAGEVETPDMVQARIQKLVDQHPILLFMKGAKSFPQCGFSDTATKILDRLDAGDYHAVDVLSDPMIREGIKVYSQ